LSSAARVGEEFEPLARLHDLPDGALLAVRKANGEDVCLFNRGGVIGAVYDICTHAEFSMADGQLQGAPHHCAIQCAWHGAIFDCRTGAVLRGPATDPLPVYVVRIEGDTIYVGGRTT
jgi:3-phenylpropionate/trans-cinnamate dioxygenase ferredoxin component